MIRFVVALPAEARPLIDHYRLRRRQPAGPFPIYETGSIALIVSGAGKIAAASASGYLQALRHDEPHACWLNVGLAGHKTRAVGDAILAQRITDRATSRSWRPPLCFQPPCDLGDVLTVDAPEYTFAEPACYDMEASGFCQTAGRFSVAQLVHCLKVISDNATHAPGRVDARTAQQLITGQLGVIDRLVQELSLLSAKHAHLEFDGVALDPTARRR